MIFHEQIFFGEKQGQNLLAAGRVRFVVPDTLKLQVFKPFVLVQF